jgi:hypothetical protein
MPEVAPLGPSGPFSEIRDAFTHKRTWVLALVSLAFLIFAVRWPSVFGIIWEFSLLCCFPAGLFVWAAVSSGAVRKPPMTKIVITVLVVHCLLLATTAYLWRKSPKLINGDYAFAFVMVEVAVIALLIRFARPRRGSSDSGK